MVDLPAPGVSRRALMAAGAGAAGLVLGGCTLDNPVSGDASPRSPGRLAPDVAVATRALDEIRAVRAATSSTLSRFPAARGPLGALLAMHHAHEVSLADAVPVRARGKAAPARFVVARKRDVALRNLARREQRLHETLDALALRAQSGDFARLLASMGAAVGQQLARWPQ